MPVAPGLKKTVLDDQQMYRMIRRMAGEVADRNRGVEDLMLIGIRTRGVPLAEALAAEMQRTEGVEVPIGVLDITLYRDDLSAIAPQPVVKETRLSGPIDDRVLVLCDDVLYTGRTVRAALDALIDYGRPKAVQLVVMIDRGDRELPIQADVVGRQISVEADELVEVRFKATDGADEVVILERVSDR